MNWAPYGHDGAIFLFCTVPDLFIYVFTCKAELQRGGELETDPPSSSDSPKGHHRQC